uniref:Pentatricopeptide repeat-containing protein n=1 Tax=Solanum lycopersicum TaxID=4081 RepID=K4D8B7_SOLLC
MTQLSLRPENPLLSMFIGLGNLGDASYVFDKTEKRNVFLVCFWEMEEKDVFLVFFFCENGHFDEALDLYQRMLWIGIRPDVYIFPCVSRTCGGMPDWRIGRKIHAYAIRFSHDSEIDIVNALIIMYVKCGDVCSARVLFDGMSKRDRISWIAMISGYFENACEALGNERLGRALHGYVSRMNFNSSLIQI